MIKFLQNTTAVMTSMFASLVILFAVISNDDIASIVVKVGLAILVIIVSIVTIFGKVSVKDECRYCWIMMFGSIFFLVLGGAGMALNTQMYLTTGHNEGHFFIFYGILVLQGALTIYLLVKDRLNNFTSSAFNSHNILMF